MQPIYFDLREDELQRIIRKYYEAQGFVVGGSQAYEGNIKMNVQLYVEDVTEIGGGE